MKMLMAGFAIILPAIIMVSMLCLSLAELCVHSIAAKHW